MNANCTHRSMPSVPVGLLSSMAIFVVLVLGSVQRLSNTRKADLF